jgi:imidazolonepropionase-like amidohydrolase
MRPDTPFAIQGCVRTPDEALEDHHVVVAGGEIQDVVGPAPAGMPMIVSDGVILPGLIDLHGHLSTTSSPPGSRLACTPIGTHGGAAPSTTPSSGNPRHGSPALRTRTGRRSGPSCRS